ncbi:MAG: XrtA-associated tyrosine autokinase [Burkholderiales bacterium]
MSSDSVSLIEQAAKRLEELKRAGVEGAGAPSDVQPEARGHGPATPLPPRRDTSRPAEPARISRTVRIDLARLGAEGFVTPESPRSPIANEFRVLKRPLLANAQPKSGTRSKNTNLIMVTSSLAEEGKSFTAVNLALSMAMELDTTVLLVDADVANPSLLQMLGLPQTKGLLDVLTDDKLDLRDVMLRTNVDKLSLLPAGTSHPRATELLASDAMTRLVEEMANRYPDRIIVFDSPPLLLTTESRALAGHMGQIVLVVEAERTTAAAVKTALGTIESCPIILTVLNKTRTPELGSYYGYGYGYGSQSAAAGREPAR